MARDDETRGEAGPEPLAVAAADLLGARPLLFGLEAATGVRLRVEPAAALAGLLRRGEVDAALMPAIDYFRLAADPAERARSGRSPKPGGPERPAPTQFVALPVGAVGSAGSVGSVRLFGYAEKDRLRRVALDPEGVTASALARLIILRRFGAAPHFVVAGLPCEASASAKAMADGLAKQGEPGKAAPRPPDAELLAGDRALAAERPAALWTSDLGDEWHRFTYLPFVYAFWAARADGPLDRLVPLLAAALDRGLAAREALADEAAPRLGIPAEVARRHLMHEVRYDFGRRQREGLLAFYRMAAEDGLAPEGARNPFIGWPPSRR